MHKEFDVEEVMQQMTMEEKVYLLQAKDDWHLNGVERLGVPSVMLTDGPNGVRIMVTPNEEPVLTTSMPVESLLSSSWDTELEEKVGESMGRECRRFGVNILLGPGANAKRSPLGGRNFEYFSEDPYLSGKMAAAMIRGVQSQGVGTSLKHYVANDQETRRFSMNANVDERTLHEICLKPFQIAIQEGNPTTIMGAYPRVQGTYACENKYMLEDVLRDSYGYEGVVLSDWGACVDKVASVRNGLDLETGSYERQDQLLTAIESGEISMDVIDTHVKRVLELIRKVTADAATVPFDWDQQHAMVVKAAGESMVLLKNNQNVLPLDRGKKIAVIGNLAKNPHFAGAGSSTTMPHQLDIPLEYIGKYSNVTYADGYIGVDAEEGLIREAVETARNADTLLVFVGTLASMDSEGSDRADIKLPDSQTALLQKLSELDKTIVLINSSGSAMDLSYADSVSDAVLYAGLGGEGVGAAIADILFGTVNPSGKLTETFPLCIEHTPAYPFYPGDEDEVYYKEEIFNGYRYYDTKKMPVLYPFGYGLSYTTFAYSNLKLSEAKINKDDELTVTVEVTNTGSLSGAEVVELYVSDKKSYLMRPEKELKEFSKIFLNPGETRQISFALNKDAFAYYVPHLHRYAVESGIFEIMIGASSRDIRLSECVEVISDDEVRKPLTGGNIMQEFYEDDRYTGKVKAVLDILHTTEDNPLFPVIMGIRLVQFPRFLKYLHISDEAAEQMVNMILN